MTVKYQIGWSDNIVEIDVDRETLKTVFLADGRRLLKESSYSHVFDTKAEAVAHIRHKLESEVASYERLYNAAKQRLSDFVDRGVNN